ncbi:AbrB/MazE/SpoVT family DNA-binding domain-containing protein (plasmid) [Alkalihalobacillus hwajinpoensis]|uniref:AbrB/MazE/SpoVT family DNA-binding domain-containing protein n=1 Tax=Guptibacillus hwajinpoensis TaxID=208199 RepID=UPI001883C12A|nr:AbrB/MazE/SpoVT family DNA-binding domain-containing protein [Pseudalkalibacillus hwajinpoensis]MBF0706625.1 AbrB/MazE/SpoVT family DNA-binding domain-containing protein [Pseudalkalibacillus hwajinpoensis]
MKSTGIVRKTDGLGRVVIPIELRRALGIEEKDPIAILVDDDKIILEKHKSNLACAITGEINDDNKTYGNGKLVLSSTGVKILRQELDNQGI